MRMAMNSVETREADTGPSQGSKAARISLLPYAYEATVFGRRCRIGRTVTLKDFVPVRIRHVDAADAPASIRLRRRAGVEASSDNVFRAPVTWRRFGGHLFRPLGNVEGLTVECLETDLGRSGAGRNGSCASSRWDISDYPIRSLPTDSDPDRPAPLLPSLETLSLWPLRQPFREQASDRCVRQERAAAHLAEALLIVDGELWVSPSRDCEPYWMIFADRFDERVRVELRFRSHTTGEGSHRFSIERLPVASAHAVVLSKAWGVPDWPVSCDLDVVQVDPDVAVDDVRACALDALVAVDATAQAEVEGRWGGDAVEAFARLVVLQRTLSDPLPSDVVRILQAFVTVAEGPERRMAIGSAASRMAALARDVAWRWNLTECSERADLAALWHPVAREEVAIRMADAAALATLAP